MNRCGEVLLVGQTINDFRLRQAQLPPAMPAHCTEVASTPKVLLVVDGRATVTVISGESDIVAARQRGRQLAGQLGFALRYQVLVATAIWEIAHNIVQYAGTGTMSFRALTQDGRRGLRIVAQDGGPGIPDVARALDYGYSTSNGMGLGLAGARQIMDEFAIVSGTSTGTTVTMTKWVP